MVEKERVCVTGGGGYQASWLIKLLLSKGYMVHASVRDPENLQLFKADLLDYDGLFAAIQGCNGIEIIEPAVTARRLVIVSSISAVMYNSNWPKGQPMDEFCWSDKESCQTTKYGTYSWYYVSKTIAESQALEYAKNTGLEVVTVCPSIIIGPMLQSTMNASSLFIYLMLKDVRDMAEALLLVYEKPEAEGRYICSSYRIMAKSH
ncbi:hypothetical protein AQUCO_10900005v1 [Aquilegia coerulea]|uniref:Thioester reductase (TE) domain-containing protein n=1 Tax=Aquilegia coerulea TaxID=218851 RepID=A0A2G5C2Y8_AQUCA|nr:hypothetical protein AQUCO_10900005v1 [Aquilegia coerulea]